MADTRITLYIFLLTLVSWSPWIACYREPGIRKLKFSEHHKSDSFAKTLFKGSELKLRASCSASSDYEKKPKIKISWTIKSSPCGETFLSGGDLSDVGALVGSGHGIYDCDAHIPIVPTIDAAFSNVAKEMETGVQLSTAAPPSAENGQVQLSTTVLPAAEAAGITPVPSAVPPDVVGTALPKPSTTGKPQDKEVTAKPTTGSNPGTAPIAKRTKGSFKKKAQPVDSDNDATSLSAKANDNPKPKAGKNHPKAQKKQEGFKTSQSGAYLLSVYAELVETTPEKPFKLEVVASFESKYGYLSASEWPLLPFYGVLSLLYLGYALGWFIASCCNWRDLLRVQFWVCGVIALGMLENAVFYSELQNINSTGNEATSLVIFAEIIAAMKRTLARILVIIVSMGFGIVKPRLGPALHKLMGTALVYFILAVVEGCLRAVRPKSDPSRQAVFAFVPLAVLDAIICWWIFSALVQTTRTLRIRKNVVKLTIYRHFTNTLIFAVIASVAYMVYAIKTTHLSNCRDWSEAWLDEAFWPFLFSVILLVIMILWRPTNNNQRYAFTPLVDMEEGEDQTLSDAFEGMKLRNMRKSESNGTAKRNKVEDDLKWVEENIPSVPATVLPTLDSDEELMTTNFEISKME